MDRQPAHRLDPDQGFLADRGAQALCTILEAAGHETFFVGGCVRNAVLGVAASDVDIATEAIPHRVMSLVADAGHKAVPTGIEHGTVTVVIDGQPFEVTTFRKDVATDGRRATVTFATDMAEDAKRRDFTMNALYSDPRGHVFDPVGGLNDALARHVRFIGDGAKRIREDYLRILRFFRFSAWYGDATQGWDPDALAAIAANLDGLQGLSAERVGVEMLKLLAAPDPVQAVHVMAQTGALSVVLPGADPLLLGPLVHLETQEGVAPDPMARLAALGGHDTGDRLRLSKRQKTRLADIRTMAGTDRGPAAIGQLVGAEAARAAMLLRAALAQTPLPASWLAEVDRGAASVFPVAATDLPDLSGPPLGQRLTELRQMWLASDLTLSKADLLAS